MAGKDDDTALETYLQAQIGAAGSAFCTFAAGELARRCQETAIREGCSPGEAAVITRHAVQRCIKALVNGIATAKYERQFQRLS